MQKDMQGFKLSVLLYNNKVYFISTDWLMFILTNTWTTMTRDQL